MSQVLEQFYKEKIERLAAQGRNKPLKDAADEFLRLSLLSRYSYNFSWLGRPVIQYPEDMVALQEIVWQVKPRLIIETGVAHGGSAIFFASMLEMLGGDGLVLGIDIVIRPHNRPLIEGHPLAKRVRLLEASSLDEPSVGMARELAQRGGPVMVVLDSNHTLAHVAAELELYAPLVSVGSYLVVFDGVVERFPGPDNGESRPWGPGDNPLVATRNFLAAHPEFAVDTDIENKLLISAAPEGYLKRLR